MKEMQILIKLLGKKHFGENKRDNLYNQLLGDGCSNTLGFMFVAFQLFIWVIRINKGEVIFSKIDSFKGVEIIFFCIGIFFGGFTNVRNIFACYYKLPRYRRKICEIDHQIIEELEKLSI